MKIKVCYNHEIHRLPKVPDTLEGLLQLVSTIFHAQLPDAWGLQYTDRDGDNIRIASEKDYDEFKNAEQASTAISKVHIVAIDGAKQPEVAPEEVIIVDNDNKEDEEYQVIQSEEKKDIVPQVEADEVKKEPVIEKKEEPVEIKEEQIKEPVEKNEKKVYVDMETLEKLVSMMIEKSLPKISEFTQQQIEKQKASELQGLLSNDDSFLADQPSQPLRMPHYGVSCDGCAMSPVMGIRYKCEKCPNFDLCEKCEGEGKHSHHNFIKMKEHSFLSAVRPVLSNKESESFFKPEICFEMKELKKEEEPREERRGNSNESMPTAQEIAYYDNLVEKVRKLLKVFPNSNFDLACVFVNDAPEDLDMEELIENFKH